jgi:hypothetical protein
LRFLTIPPTSVFEDGTEEMPLVRVVVLVVLVVVLVVVAGFDDVIGGRDCIVLVLVVDVVVLEPSTKPARNRISSVTTNYISSICYSFIKIEHIQGGGNSRATTKKALTLLSNQGLLIAVNS